MSQMSEDGEKKKLKIIININMFLNLTPPPISKWISGGKQMILNS